MNKHEFEILQRTIRAHGKITVSVLGDSMWPTLHNGQKVIVSYAKSYRIGDIVAYFIQTRLVVHRIYSINKTVFVAKGDNKMTIDPCTSLNRILGRVDISVPKKYLHGLYRLSCAIVNKSDLPVAKYLATGVENHSFEDEKNKKLMIAICRACANYNWLRPLEIHIHEKRKTLSYLEFHIYDEICVEDCLANKDESGYDAVVGLGDPVFYDMLGTDQKALYVSSQILVIRQCIEIRLGEIKYGQGSKFYK